MARLLALLWVCLWPLRRLAAAIPGKRLLVCLPLCLLLAPAYPDHSPEPRESATQFLGLGDLPARDPIAFLEKCLEHYDRTVKTGYRLTMRKQERIGKKVQDPEEIDVWYRDRPHSVFFGWSLGARLALRVLYVEGENNGNMLAQPRFFPKLIVSRDPKGSDAKQSGRYPISEFGLKQAMELVLKGWKEARAEGALHVAYLGVHRVPLAGDRPCYKLHRTSYARPEEDGITELILYVDTETLLQVGTELWGKDHEFIASYYFRDIRIDPPFRPDQFTEAALKPKS
jgi:hypothetical protein